VQEGEMKLGKGHNEYHLNTATMVAILNKHMEYSTDQVVTGVTCVNSSGLQTFIIQLEDKKLDEVSK
jgi:hypothetical protein